jgi:hypothetical protein
VVLCQPASHPSVSLAHSISQKKDISLCRSSPIAAIHGRLGSSTGGNIDFFTLIIDMAAAKWRYFEAASN